MLELIRWVGDDVAQAIVVFGTICSMFASVIGAVGVAIVGMRQMAHRVMLTAIEKATNGQPGDAPLCANCPYRNAAKR